jgi:alcohol dehydrogenase class IV
VLDPDLVDGCPAPVVASTGVDAMVHGIESFLNVQSNPITEALVLGGLRLLGPSLRPAVLSRLDHGARGRLLDGCALTALGMNMTGVGLVHAMSDPLTVHVHAPHGVANSALLPYVMAYNAPAAGDRLAVLAAAAGVRDLPSGLAALVADLGLPRTLAELGVTHDLIPRLAEDAMLSRNVGLTCRPAAVGDVEAIYRRALDGPPPTEGETLA